MDSLMKNTFGKLVESLRLKQGLSVYALAQRTGLSDQAIHDLEQSDRVPSFDTARRLAKILDVSLDWMAGQLPDVDLPPPMPGRPRGRPPKPPAPPAPKKRKPRGV